jgi:hypothetical protein
MMRHIAKVYLRAVLHAIQRPTIAQITPVAVTHVHAIPAPPIVPPGYATLATTTKQTPAVPIQQGRSAILILVPTTQILAAKTLTNAASSNLYEP